MLLEPDQQEQEREGWAELTKGVDCTAEKDGAEEGESRQKTSSEFAFQQQDFVLFGSRQSKSTRIVQIKSSTAALNTQISGMTAARVTKLGMQT